MASIPRESSAQPGAPRFDPRPGKVRYSPRWLSAGAGLGLFASLALRHGGLPAAAALGAVGLAGATYALSVEPRNPELSFITLNLPELPPALDGLRIGQISDLHLGHPFSAENCTWAVERVRREAPDLIALTGDFVSYARAIDLLPRILAPLTAPLGVFAVPGNHDHWEGLDEIRAQLEPVGVQFLINRGLVAGPAGALYVAGIDDIWNGQPDLAAALAGRPAGAFTLLLAHAPDIADEAAARGVHVLLSGHTHGGHLRLPFLGAFCLPRHGWLYAVGHEHVGSMQLFVSRGIAGVPLRLGCRPEASIITLRRA